MPKDINQAWEILETEFANEQKLMDKLLAEMNNLKHVKRDSKSITHYATTISAFAALCWRHQKLRSQLLSKLDTRDNTNFGREMQRAGKEENVSNLVTWLHQEATLCSRGKPDNENAGEKERTQRGPTFCRTENHTASNDRTPDQEACPSWLCVERPFSCLSAVFEVQL